MCLACRLMSMVFSIRANEWAGGWLVLLHRETPLFTVYSSHSQLPDSWTQSLRLRWALAKHICGQHVFLMCECKQRTPNRIIMRSITVDGAFIALKFRVLMLNSLLTSADVYLHVEQTKQSCGCSLAHEHKYLMDHPNSKLINICTCPSLKSRAIKTICLNILHLSHAKNNIYISIM